MHKSPASFIEYALSDSLTEDEIYTIERLVDKAQVHLDPEYWETQDVVSSLREKPDYKPSFAVGHLQPAAEYLESLTWLSLQRLNDKSRPIRDLTAIRYLPNLTSLVLTKNEVNDLSPLKYCKKLSSLSANNNPIQNLSPLRECVTIETLEIQDTPVEDLSSLEALPKLKKLSVSTPHIPALCRLTALHALEYVELDSDQFTSFNDFPEMPSLRVMRSAKVESLKGLEKFTQLQNLVNLSGSFDSLEPLSALKELTHANILSCQVTSLQPLACLLKLRYLYFNTEAKDIDITPLESLPALHQTVIKCSNEEHKGLKALQASLPSWDVAFKSERPKYTSALLLQVTDDFTFTHHFNHSYNISALDTNPEMLSSESDWLQGKIVSAMPDQFVEEEDYGLSYLSGKTRGLSITLISDEIISSLGEIVLVIQNELAHANHDWIVYLESDSLEHHFLLWIYPDRITTTAEYAETVKELL